jgi:hypothetical protein
LECNLTDEKIWETEAFEGAIGQVCEKLPLVDGRRWKEAEGGRRKQKNAEEEEKREREFARLKGEESDDDGAEQQRCKTKEAPRTHQIYN